MLEPEIDNDLGKDDNLCPICLDDLNENILESDENNDVDSIMRLPKCSHVFHIKCINDWMAINAKKQNEEVCDRIMLYCAT
jgi:hypothetical protein